MLSPSMHASTGSAAPRPASVPRTKAIPMPDPLLTVRDFSVVYDVDPPVAAVKNVTLELQRGEILGLAGESGCGKTTLAYGVQRLLKAPAVITSGSVTFHDADGDDIDVSALGAEQMRRFRWDKISMVFQGAMNALNPVATIGAQLEDVFEVHRPGMSRKQRREAVAELLEIVKVGAQRARSFPHELSGGMRQRVMIAMALALRPQLMVMDEPTTALDVLVQREILRQISQLREEFGFSVIFITHDLPLLLEISDRIAIMREGEIVEIGTAERIWNAPQDEYTKTLLSSFPRLTGEKGVVVR
ncbi:ABC transporter ATP-binding protein [Microbacterium shaanxiense]